MQQYSPDRILRFVIRERCVSTVAIPSHCRRDNKGHESWTLATSCTFVLIAVSVTIEVVQLIDFSFRFCNRVYVYFSSPTVEACKIDRVSDHWDKTATLHWLPCYFTLNPMRESNLLRSMIWKAMGGDNLAMRGRSPSTNFKYLDPDGVESCENSGFSVPAGRYNDIPDTSEL